MSAENNRKIENLIRYGVIAEVDCAARRARVQSGEILTDWLPWSSVNNCTEQKIDNLTLFLNARQNDVEIVQKALKPICLPLNDRQLAYLLKGNLLVLNHKQSVRFINNKVEIIQNQEPVPFMGDAGEWFVQ
ncbi:hypothetical protein JP36_09005 [Gallibacterium genomosp. 1]|uniref:Uncharacterized protein n=1 Tax=Gallibacterium genomosp. 1 TaxID=155515 RepID=A0A0A2Y0N5_9PAST|nr:hypothetical protein JP36_09005 [Gallibacterium genomosp. 1]